MPARYNIFSHIHFSRWKDRDTLFHIRSVAFAWTRWQDLPFVLRWRRRRTKWLLFRVRSIVRPLYKQRTQHPPMWHFMHVRERRWDYLPRISCKTDKIRYEVKCTESSAISAPFKKWVISSLDWDYVSICSLAWLSAPKPHEPRSMFFVLGLHLKIYATSTMNSSMMEIYI